MEKSEQNHDGNEWTIDCTWSHAALNYICSVHGCVCVQNPCTCDIKQCTYIDCSWQKLPCAICLQTEGFVQIAMHRCTGCVCFMHIPVWNWALWVCFDRSQLLRSRSTHWRDVSPVNGCSGAWALWHSFEYRRETHVSMNTHTHTFNFIQ